MQRIGLRRALRQVIAFAVVFAAFASFTLVACSKKEESQPPATDGLRQKISEEQMITALMRSLPAVDQICNDPSRDRAFLVHFVEGRIEGWQGWYFIEHVDFYALPNGTFFVTALPADRYVSIYPKVDGLKCGTEMEYPHQ